MFFERNLSKKVPLAYKMAPESLEDFKGQNHLIGSKGILKQLIEKDRIPSCLFFGPPGTGKTSLARIISNKTSVPFFHLNASTSRVQEVRKILLEGLKFYKSTGKPCILFIDEIHRFNRLQQEILLPSSEKGEITLIGSTVLNPFFVIDKALLSRLMLFEFKPLSTEHLIHILKSSINNDKKGLGTLKLKADEDVLERIALSSEGDARRALNTFELIAETLPQDQNRISLHHLEKLAQFHRYDRKGDVHYDIISAFIKSLRGSDPDATLYWLFRMVDAGEDPRFIFRRMLIFASEDVGLSEPMAIVITQNCAASYEMVGLPEGEFHLAMAALYLSLLPKSNSILRSIIHTKKAIEEKKYDVPVHLKDSHYYGAKKLGYGKGYRYPHSDPVSGTQKYIPESLKLAEIIGKGKEKIFKEKLEKLRRERWKLT